KAALMKKLGSKQLTLHLHTPLQALPEALANEALSLAADGHELVYTYDGRQEEEGRGISTLLTQLEQAGISFKDLHTRQSSLEDIFVDLVKERS
ncbi:MAG: multidrug ABC transporter ATP-binding protein, partial [Pseudomonadota bacterium]|nr:multidrug ABC transporter ATP-binding protein [Pseudomonadota bacterium]